MPLSVNGSVIALIILDNVTFEKLSLFYTNNLKIAADMLSEAYSNAQVYAKLSTLFMYEDETGILKTTEFEKALQIAKKGEEESKFNYTLLEIKQGSGKTDIEISEILQQGTRNIDEIGRLPNGNIGVILYSTSKENSEIVRTRFEKAGLESVVIENS
jgi:hypothetical protein